MANALPDGSVQVFSEVTRFSQLDADGFIPVGAAVYVTNQLIKATFTPVMETGVDLVLVNANADISAHFKHGDMPKYYTAALDMQSTQDAILHAMLAGGTVLTDSTAALGVYAPPVPTGQITLGTLPANTYGYRATEYNAYGETAVSTEATAVVASGTTGAVVVAPAAMAPGALGARVFGRSPGGEQFMGVVPNIGSQATSAASGTGTVTALTVTALTKAIPSGTQFQIVGDTNTTKIVFTTTAPAGIGAVSLAVSASQSITTTIAPAALTPVFVDNGSIVPAGHYSTTDSTAGPGNDVGWQAPPLAVVSNPNGIGCEFWGKAVLNGTQVSYLPYGRWVIPGVKYLHEEAHTFQANFLENNFAGQAFENPNWGSGPFGDWQFDSSKVMQYARASRYTVPVAGLTTTAATA